MTIAARTLVNRLESLGYHVLYYRRGVMYIAGLGVRDTEWAIRTIRRAELYRVPIGDVSTPINERSLQPIS